MNAERIARWSEAVGAKEAAKRLGIHTQTLGRYTSGEVKPTGPALTVLTAAVEAWEASKEEASQ